jgi:2-polyprenyl-3-methyl-5-hydroxy-6-metoxy-1,4-benzoquinol methylase
MPRLRERQLAYSDTQALMLDEGSRRVKAAKIAAIIQHFRGGRSLDGLDILDVGCSGGIIADELHRRGARMIGLDIDIPGLSKAGAQFADSASFVCADSERMPLADASVDVVICNHVYEHVVDPEQLFAELRRVVRPDGLLYLGLGNRLGVVEPHYRLPFLSWLPRPLAHRYVRLFGRADHYHEAFLTWSGLKRLCAGLQVWDYTYAVLSDPRTFAAGDVVPRWTGSVPAWLLKAARPLVPTYIWVATRVPSRPLGPPTPIPPHLIVQGSRPPARSRADT